MTLLVDGVAVSAGESPGGLPEQPGRARLLAGRLLVGLAPGSAPMGHYDRGSSFAGGIDAVTLRVE